MVAFAPVMFVGNQTSDLISAAVKNDVDIILAKIFDTFLVFDFRTYFDEFVFWIAPRAICYIPRTVWTFVSGIVGYDNALHMDYGRLPMMGRNDVGGTGMNNIKHWAQNMRTGKFQTLER